MTIDLYRVRFPCAKPDQKKVEWFDSRILAEEAAKGDASNPGIVEPVVVPVTSRIAIVDFLNKHANV